MVDYVYFSISKYFNNLRNFGYKNQKEVNKLLFMIAIQELFDSPFLELITEEDYTAIRNAMYCIYGTSCLMPYPDYCKLKNKGVYMSESIASLDRRMNKMERHYKELMNKDVVIPGDIVDTVPDITPS